MQDSRRSGVLPIATEEVWDGSRVITIFEIDEPLKKVPAARGLQPLAAPH